MNHLWIYNQENKTVLIWDVINIKLIWIVIDVLKPIAVVGKCRNLMEKIGLLINKKMIRYKNKRALRKMKKMINLLVVRFGVERKRHRIRMRGNILMKKLEFSNVTCELFI